jgi:uncharacterized protein (DUF2147 family)
MRKLVLIAAMLLATSSAYAGGYSFNVQGQKVRVNIPRGCASLNCINVSAPGLEEKFKNKDKDEDTSSKPATTTTATAPAAAPAPAPVSVGPGSKVTVLTAPEAAPAPAPAPQPTVTAAPAPAPAPVSTSASSKITMLGAPEAAPSTAPTTSGSTLTAPQVSLSPAPVQVAAVPAAAPAQAAPAARTSDSPIGVWMTEEKGSKVRIENCNGNLCGYSVDAKTGASGDKVLIDMKLTGDKWVGRVRDTRSGSNYNANIAMRGSDKLRMQGCAFGGMLCGGQTWTRVE